MCVHGVRGPSIQTMEIVHLFCRKSTMTNIIFIITSLDYNNWTQGYSHGFPLRGHPSLQQMCSQTEVKQK